MKTIIASIFFLLLFSCNQPTSNNDKILEEKSTNLYVSDNTEIIGSWTMCSSFGNGIMTQYNVCPTVSFLNNGTGYVGNSSILADHFRWTLKKRALNIYYKDMVSNSTFSDTFYNTIISKQNDRLYLVISQTKKDYAFYLSK
jgi:hypothetical protein